MHSELTIAVLAGLGGMFGWGLADLFAKKTIDAIGDIVSLVWAHIFGTLLFFVLALYLVVIEGHVLHLPHTLLGWLGVIFFGVLQAFVYLFVYKGFGKGQVAVLNPLFASFSGITALGSIIVFGEMLTWHIGIALLILFIGLISMNVDREALRTNRLRLSAVPGFREVVFATGMAALWTLLWDRFIEGNDWLGYVVLMYTVMTIVILFVAQQQRITLKIQTPSMWKYLVIIGLCEVVAYAAISIGYEMTTKTSIIALISGAFSLPTICLARVFLKEKVTRLQTAGALLIILGIIVLSIS